MRRAEPFEIVSVFICSANKYSVFCQCKMLVLVPRLPFPTLEEGGDILCNLSIT